MKWILLICYLFVGCFHFVAIASSTQDSPSQFVWQMDNVDIRVVIQQIAKLTGKNVIVDPRVQGKIQLYAHHVRTQEEIYQLFLSSLSLLGYSYQEQGARLQIFPLLEGRAFARLDKHAQIRLQAFEIQHIPAQEMLTALRPLIPDAVTMTVFKPANHLLCVGEAAAIRNIQQLIQQLDVPVRRAQDPLRAYSLTHMTVQAALPLLTSLLKKYHEGAIFTAIAGEAATSQDTQAPLTNTGVGQVPVPAIAMIAHPAQQTLFISAPEALHGIIRQTLATLDKRPRQVFVEALIAQVDLDALDELGIEWGSITPEKSGLSTIGLFQQGVGVIRDNLFSTWQVVIQSLAQRQRAEIVARPAIVVLNQHTAVDRKSVV